MSFAEFWNNIVGSTGSLSPLAVAQLQAAMSQLYDDATALAPKPKALQIITALADAAAHGQQLTFNAGINYSTNVPLFRILIPDGLTGILPAFTANQLGMWIAE